METKEVVIASYKEPMDWIETIPKDWSVTVYNACETDRDFPDGLNPIKLPNMGREAGQWIHHIISRYDTLADFTLFLQADKFHVPLAIEEILNAKELPKRKLCYVGSAFEKHGLPARLLPCQSAFLKRLWLDEPIPEPIPFIIGAQFYATKKTIMNRPVSHYERLMRAVADTPESPYLLEATWGCVFKIED